MSHIFKWVICLYFQTVPSVIVLHLLEVWLGTLVTTFGWGGICGLSFCVGRPSVGERLF